MLDGLRRLSDLYAEWNGQLSLALWQPMPWAVVDLPRLANALAALVARLIHEEGRDNIRYLSPYPRPDKAFGHGIEAWLELVRQTKERLTRRPGPLQHLRRLQRR